MSGEPGGLTIALLGHYGNQNLGDEAIIQAARTCIGRRLGNATMIGISANPADTEKRHGMAAFPVRRGLVLRSESANGGDGEDTVPTAPAAAGGGPKSDLRRLLKALPLVWPLMRAARNLLVFTTSTLPKELAFNLRCVRFLRRVDMVLISGSGQFIDDWNGAWSFPYTLARWAVLSKLAGAKFGAISVGAGPIDGWLGKRFYRLCLSLCDYRSLRDERSREVMREIGFRKGGLVCPDLAHSMGELAAHPVPAGDRGTRPVVGVNPMPILDRRYWHTDEPEKTARYRAALTEFCATLMREGYPLFFYKTHPTDQCVIDDIIDALREVEGVDVSRADLVRTDDSVDEVMATVASADIVVATRFHGVLLPLTMNVPAVGVYHNHKTMELMEQMGQADYAVNFHDITGASLLEAFRRLEANLDSERAKLREIGARQRRALDDQCDRLAALLPARLAFAA
jgi:polysaccharide pyruvyl transferase WcaK-like protein